LGSREATALLNPHNCCHHCCACRSAYDAATTAQLLLLVSDLLEQPPAFGARHKALLQQLLQPLQEHLAELSAEQLTQVRRYS
jgi:hypothetical protein